MTRSLIWLTSVRHTTCSVNYVILEPKCIILAILALFGFFGFFFPIFSYFMSNFEFLKSRPSFWYMTSPYSCKNWEFHFWGPSWKIRGGSQKIASWTQFFFKRLANGRKSKIILVGSFWESFKLRMKIIELQ